MFRSAEASSRVTSPEVIPKSQNTAKRNLICLDYRVVNFRLALPSIHRTVAMDVYGWWDLEVNRVGNTISVCHG